MNYNKMHTILHTVTRTRIDIYGSWTTTEEKLTITFKIRLSIAFCSPTSRLTTERQCLLLARTSFTHPVFLRPPLNSLSTLYTPAASTFSETHDHINLSHPKICLKLPYWIDRPLLPPFHSSLSYLTSSYIHYTNHDLRLFNSFSFPLGPL